jgi:hypothetical protein
MPPTALLEELPDGTTRAWGTTENVHWLAPRLSALPWPFTVLGPEPLKVTMREIGARLLRAAGT